MLESQEIFQNVCKSHVTNKSLFAVDRVFIDLHSPRFMEKLELVDKDDNDVQPKPVNDYVVSEWV